MKNRSRINEWILRRRVCWRNWCRMNREDFMRDFWSELNGCLMWLVGGGALLWLIILWWRMKPH